LQGQLQNEQDSLNTAKQQRVYYQSMAEQYRNLHASGKSVDGSPTEVTTYDQELAKLRSQLMDLRSRYTDSYPDVQRVKEQISETEKQKQAFLAAPKLPVKQGSGSEIDSGPLAQLQSQLQANQLEISSRERAIARLEASVNEYQARLNAQPGTEQQLADLTRGYEQSKANYDDLLRKKNQSTMATSMEHLQQGERFTMLDPPSLPGKPSYPNRLKFCAMGLALGAALGCLIVFLLEFFDDRMHGEKEIKALLSMQIMSEIPEVQGPSDLNRAKARLVLGWALTGVVGLVIVAGSAYSFLRG
jgi:uncharacterized protein involved in exopolysaccharide biosynthesis